MTHAKHKDPLVQMVLISLAMHGVLFVFMTQSKRFFASTPLHSGLNQSQALNVLWAETVTGPPKTPEHKLPGPMLFSKPENPSGVKEQGSVLIKKSKDRPTNESKISSEISRKMAMEDALSSLNASQSDDRPKPNINNFASVDGAKQSGLPAAPYGGGQSLMAQNPQFAAYKSTIQKKITEQFVWIQNTKNLKAMIIFKLDQRGYIQNPVIYKSSGHPAFDQAALRAVIKSSPLELPQEDLLKDLLNENFVIVFEPK